MLRLVDILLKEAIDIKISPGIWVRVPSPCSFLLHKLLIANRWNRGSKKEKDLKQAVYIGQYVLADEPEKQKLLSLWQTFSPAWKSKVKKALADAHTVLPLKSPLITHLQSCLQ